MFLRVKMRGILLFLSPVEKKGYLKRTVISPCSLFIDYCLSETRNDYQLIKKQKITSTKYVLTVHTYVGVCTRNID